MQWLNEISSWHWASLGVILLILEIMGTAGFLIGTAIAAFLMAAIMVFFPETDWKWQLTLFSSMAIVFSLIYLKRFSRFNETTDHPNLNNRAALLVGKRLLLKENTANGEGRVQAGDTYWQIKSETEIEAGTQIDVIAADGMVLIVKPADS